MSEKIIKKNFSTTDFYTIAILLYTEYEMLEITHEGPKGKDKQGRVKRFHFEDSPELRETIRLYINSKIDGNLRKFCNAIETVKNMVH